jgi:predicted CxxxxCH...CXXCH cytochrome family protein
MRDRGVCQRCGKPTYPNLPDTANDSYHMAHKRNKRMWGDTLDNVQTECGSCHRAWHLNGPTMTKPVPAKVKA